MATIPVVAPNELIQSSWGNAVANELNGNVVKKAATQSMAGPLNVTNAVSGSSLTATSGNIAATAGNISAPAGTVGAGVVPSDTAIGTIMRSDGAILSTVNDPSPLNFANVTLQRTGVSSGVGGLFASFRRLAGGAQIGSIAIVSGPGVVYNTTSDRRLKDIVGDVEDPLGLLGRLRPRRLRWKAEPEAGDFDGFIADEVQEVVPIAVTGEPGATLSEDDPYDPGGIDPQQLDVSRLIPILVAAVQELAGRVLELEGPATK